MAEIKMSKQMLLDGAQMSIAATIAAIAGFLKEHDISFKDFVAYMGEKFEDSLGGLEGEGVDNVMKHLLMLEILPMGAQVTSSEMSPDKAEVTLTSLPPVQVLEKFGTTPRLLLKDFGVTKKEYESIYETYGPALQAIGLKFKHYSKGDQEILVLERIQ